MAILSVSEVVFACHSAACRPPTSGGTGGSKGGASGGKRMGGGSVRSDVRGGGNGNGYGARSTKASRGEKAAKNAEDDRRVSTAISNSSVKNNAVHVGGKAITNSIKKTPGGWATTLKGPSFAKKNLRTGKVEQTPVLGGTKKQLMEHAAERYAMHVSKFPVD